MKVSRRPPRCTTTHPKAEKCCKRDRCLVQQVCSALTLASFANGKIRAECLNRHWVMSLEDAAEKSEAWRRDYNEERPHGAIGHKAPAELMKSAHDTSPCA